jgi:hypothetical protein
VAVAPASLPVGSGKATVAVTVSSAGDQPTGQVELYAGLTRLSTATLVDGKATATVGPFTTVGTRSITARYLGDAVTRPSESPAATFAVTKALPRMTVNVGPRKIVAKKTRTKVAVAVRATGFTPAGTVRVKVGTKSYAGTLRGGAVTIKLAPFRKPGRYRATVTYTGDALTRPASATTTIRVRR